MIAAVYELFIEEAFKIWMSSSMQKINVGLHASMSVCKVQFISVKAIVVAKLSVISTKVQETQVQWLLV